MANIPPLTSDEWDRILSTTAQIAAMQSRSLLPADDEPSPATSSDSLQWPPGAAGALAQLLFHSSIRPVKEVSIVTTLAFLAGLTGQGWNTDTGTGLNLYIVLVARSGIGKEAIGDGISMLVSAAVKGGSFSAANFFSFDSVASGPALVKLMLEQPSLLHVSGEFGHNVRLMAVDKNGPYATLRQQMTKLYSKSGVASIAGGIRYSDAANSAQIEGSVAYSVIGETTPGTFFDALSGSMMADGFMSRFLVVEYDGPRPPENENRVTPDETWAKWLADLVLSAQQRSSGAPLPVTRDEDAKALLRKFNLRCDEEINATKDEARRQMWNRAHLKALKVASLLAVADNRIVPCITAEHAQWAIALVEHDIRGMSKRIDSGDIGESDDTRRQKVLACMRDWSTKQLGASYRNRKGWAEMQKNSIMPRAYLSIRVHTLPAFDNHKFGKDGAIDAAISSLVRDGFLMEVHKDRVVDSYGFHGVAYRVLKLD
jgi:hypothetical protein